MCSPSHWTSAGAPPRHCSTPGESLKRIGEPDPDLLETLEALTARFARLEDILIERVFRAVAAVELSDAERLLDVLDLMERLHLIVTFAHHFRYG
jgi:hypothetical protein